MKNQREWRLMIYCITTIAVAGLIFFFSSQPAKESSEMSGFFAHMLERMFGSILPEDALQFFVRKAAHMTIYFCLGISSFLLFAEMADVYGFLRMKLYVWAVAVLFCFLYACSDEWHQTFVQGRSGEFRDVMIDGIGFCTAVICVVVIRRLRFMYRRHKLALM